MKPKTTSVMDDQGKRHYLRCNAEGELICQDHESRKRIDDLANRIEKLEKALDQVSGHHRNVEERPPKVEAKTPAHKPPKSKKD